MRTPYLFVVLALCLCVSLPLGAQKQQRDPLTDAQAQQIAEAGRDPDGRIGLYIKFLDDRAGDLKDLARRAPSAARTHRIDDALQDFSALMDELGSNLDMYGDRKADMRTGLKTLNEAIPRWQQILHGLTSEPGFDIAREDAIESSNDLADQTKQLLVDQTEYFNLHEKEKGQERAEPQ